MNIKNLSELCFILNAYSILIANFENHPTNIQWEVKSGVFILGKINSLNFGSYSFDNTTYIFELMEICEPDKFGVFIAPHNHNKDKITPTSEVTEYYVDLISGKWFICKPGATHSLTSADVKNNCKLLAIKVIKH